VFSNSRLRVTIIVGVREALKQPGSALTAKELMQATGTNEATMYRNISKLQAAGLIKSMGSRKPKGRGGQWERLWSWAA